MDSALAIIHALSADMAPPELIADTLRIGMEQTGATRGVLILFEGGEHRIAAEARIAGGGIAVAARQAPVTVEDLPRTIATGAVRDAAIALLEDVAANQPLAADPCIRRHRARSLVCLPLLRQGAVLGLLYLENDSAPAAFSPARLARLKLLVTQAAISLMIARRHRAPCERDARLCRLFDSSLLGIVSWDADDSICDANEAFLRIVGYSREDLRSGRVRWTDLAPPEWRRRDLQPPAATAEAGAIAPHEREFLRKDGGRAQALVAAAVFDRATQDGVAFLVDITERKGAEQARRESDREVRLIVDSIPGMVALLTADGELEVANVSLVDYFGVPIAELRQWRTNGIVHPDDVLRVEAVCGPSIESGRPYLVEQRIRRADRVYRWFENRGFPVRDETGRIIRWCVLLTDIEERKRAEDALRRSERESRLIVDSIPAMICVLSADGRLEFMNHQGLEYFGLTLEDMQRWQSGALTHPDDLAHGLEQFTGAIAAGMPWDVEVRGLRADGVYRWTQTRGAPLRDANGQIVNWYNVIIDIDERKRAEDAVAASERNLQLTIDTMPALVWSTTPEGAADFFNQHYLEYVGLTAEEASGWGWTATVHPEDVETLASTWSRCLRDGVPGEAEARIRRADGTYRWFLQRASPLRDEAGAIVKWYGVNADIEDRKRVEAELRRTYTYLAEGQRLSRCGSFFTDFTADERIWSDELYRIVEVEPGAPVTGQLLRSMVHADDLPQYDAQAERLAAGHNLESDFRIVTPRGAVKHLRSVCHIVEWKQGRPVCFGAVQDVTEMVTAQEALNRARSELAQVARVSSLGALTASIAHEVNQPLAGILTNAGTCLRMLSSEPPNVEGARETARRTIRDSQRASDVISRLRTLFSRKEFTREELSLNDAIREVIAMSLSELRRSRVRLRAELADDLPSVMGDRVQLQQVVINLVRNASDAMAAVVDRPRSLVIRTAREDGDRVRVSVQDSGTGIDPAIVPRLFDAFFTTKHNGMGIGLSVSRSIVDRHHGRIWVEPLDGPGAIFAFSIPRVGGGP